MLTPQPSHISDITTMELIHYGASSFSPEKFEPVSNEMYWCKPYGGLWTSPVDSSWGWSNWSQANDFCDLSEHFSLTFHGRLLTIDSFEDLDRLLWKEHKHFGCLCFESLLPDYDAIHLTIKGECETRHTYPKSLYGWDCETVFIMNPESIQC